MDASQSGHRDMLTRTTLQIDRGLSSPSIANVVRALQRVPGVLLAEVNAPGGRAVVAHDAGVSMASLLAAAAGAGAQATVVAESGAGAVNARVTPPLAGIGIKRLLLIVAAVTLLQASVAAMSPSIAKHHGLAPILLSCLWASVLFSFISKRGK